MANTVNDIPLHLMALKELARRLNIDFDYLPLSATVFNSDDKDWRAYVSPTSVKPIWKNLNDAARASVFLLAELRYRDETAGAFLRGKGIQNSKKMDSELLEYFRFEKDFGEQLFQVSISPRFVFFIAKRHGVSPDEFADDLLGHLVGNPWKTLLEWNLD